MSPEGHPWTGCHPVSDTWCPFSYGQTKQKRGLNNVGQVKPEDCCLSRKDSGLQGRDIQVVKPYKCGRQGPAGHLTNVWNGHPAGPCPGRGDASGGMGLWIEFCTGSKLEARTRPLPEIGLTRPDPTRAAQLNLEPEPDPKSPPPPPTTNKKKKEEGCISRLHAKKRINQGSAISQTFTS